MVIIVRVPTVVVVTHTKETMVPMGMDGGPRLAAKSSNGGVSGATVVGAGTLTSDTTGWACAGRGSQPLGRPYGGVNAGEG